MTDAGKAVESQQPAVDSAADISDRNRLRQLPAILVYLSFVIYAAARAPVPAVNEPHYLAKAKHYWNPEWCRGDLFLESANAHLLFFQTFGWPTLWLTLEQTAWLGRIVALSVLTVGWCRFVNNIVPGRWSSLWAAWGFLFLASCGNLSGEWLIGGVESKVVTYGLLFWSLAFAFENSWNRAALCMGLAISFHPVVGMWGLIAVTMAELISRSARWRRGTARKLEPTAARTPAAKVVLSAMLLVVGALPGLLPALSIVGHDSFDADYIQVYYRLSHHLDPMQFPLAAWVCYAGLFLFLLVWTFQQRKSETQRRFFWFVLATVLIGFAGLVVGYRNGPPEHLSLFAWRMKFLKLYPFRLCDAMIPIAASIAAVGLISNWPLRATGSPAGARPLRSTWSWGLFGGAMLAALLMPAPDRNASRMEPDILADWLDACRWITHNTPTDAVVLTDARESWAFKWYAERDEFVSLKDCPQDAVSIEEWNNRLLAIRDWAQRTYHDTFSAEALAELHEQHRITHILAGRLGPMEIEPVYQNATFRVYSLQEIAPEATRERIKR